MNTLWSTLLPDTPSLPASAGQTTLIPLPSLAELTLTGPESAKFLQGQATTDFREIEKGRVLPGAICSLKGRVLFSFIAMQTGDTLRLILPADQLADALAHLKKYAIFSKTELQDARTHTALLGITGDAASQQVSSLLGKAPALGEALQDDQGRWAAGVGESRYLLGIGTNSLTADWEQLKKNGQVSSESVWWAADIAAGHATVFAAARDLFQPQELNYPALEGVSYNKGCYTGQEVVARLYFRGKLKQRLYRLEANSSETPAAGSGIFAGDARVGDVVMAASVEGKTGLLAIVKNKAMAAGGLTLGDNGNALTPLPLPYALPTEKEE